MPDTAEESPAEQRSTSPRVFVSYSHTDEPYKTWVRELCERLVANGVDVVLDQWDLREGQDKNAFMEQMVADPTIDHVLVICDARYQQKANQRKGGAGTEGQIISERVYAEVDQRKFLPIIREHNDAGPCVPVFLASRIYFDFSTDQLEAKNFENLLRAIFDKPLYRKPPPGEPPAFVTDERNITGTSLHHFVLKFRQMAESGSPAATGAFADYLRGLTEALSHLKLAESPKDKQIHEEVFSRLSETVAARDEFTETTRWAMALSNADEYLPHLKRFFQNLLSLRGRPQPEGVWNEAWDDALEFVTYELYLYLVALLLDMEQPARTNKWLRSDWYVVHGYETERRRYGVFRPSPRSLYDWNNQRKPTKSISVVGHILQERASNESVSWDSICQADSTLWLKSAVDDEDWWPHTSPYGRYGTVFPMYVGADHDDVWTVLISFLGVGSRAALGDAIKASWQRRPIAYPEAGGDAQENLWRRLNLPALCGWGD